MLFYLYDLSENVCNDPSSLFLHGLIKRKEIDNKQISDGEEFFQSCTIKIKKNYR